MTIEIIGAGLGRTGTMSLKKAFERLGFGRCYHMAELIGHPEHLPHWKALHAGTDPDVEALFDGYRATVDYPGAVLYRQLMERYPEAKVVLSTRDADDWYDSNMATIYSAKPRPLEMIAMMLRMPFNRRLRQFAPVMQWADGLIWKDFFEGRFEDRAHAIDRFRRHVQEVQERVPADRLLVYEVSQGWQPLCDFLGCAVPDQPFPNINKRADFPEKRKKILRGEAPLID